MEQWMPLIQEWAIFYGMKIIAALLILIIGRWIAKGIRRFVRKILTAREVDETIISFVSSLTYVLLLAFIIIAALSQLGIQTASFVAVIGAAGLAIGFALQGSLSNFAAGFMILVFRPFKVGDYVEAAGTAGVVEETRIFTTQLRTPDNKTIIIPNAKIMSDTITNYSAKDTRRVDMVFGVSYSDDLQKVRQVLEDIINNHSRVLKDPPPVIVVSELAESSVNFTVRAWAKTADYWDVYFDTTETVKKRFDAEGIAIPFPQQDVHLYRQT